MPPAATPNALAFPIPLQLRKSSPMNPDTAFRCARQNGKEPRSHLGVNARLAADEGESDLKRWRGGGCHPRPGRRPRWIGNAGQTFWMTGDWSLTLSVSDQQSRRA